MSINYKQTESFIERLYSNFNNYYGATKAFMMCAAHESKGGDFLIQKGFNFGDVNDHGRGIVQIQENLHDDVIEQIMQSMDILREFGYENPDVDKCYHDIAYSALIFRMHFMRYKHKFPDNLKELSEYLKEYWNTEAGKAEPQDYLKDYLLWSKNY